MAPIHCPHASLLSTTVGTALTATPIATLTIVIRERAATEPVKDIHLPSFIASKAAMKNVLSPSSDAKIRLKAAKKPDRARTELAR